tara:strand:+ start:353 stop:919 length:567 start_codon:yes stop_codon:yes gene_type:complete
MAKYICKVWPTRSYPGTSPYEIEVNAPSSFQARSVAARRESCEESEIVSTKEIKVSNQNSSQNTSNASSGFGTAGDFQISDVIKLITMIVGIIKFVFPYAKYLYKVDAVGEEQEERIKNLRSKEKTISKKPVFWIFNFLLFIITINIDSLIFLLTIAIYISYFFGIRKLYVKTGNKFIFIKLVEKFSK